VLVTLRVSTNLSLDAILSNNISDCNVLLRKKNISFPCFNNCSIVRLAPFHFPGKPGD